MNLQFSGFPTLLFKQVFLFWEHGCPHPETKSRPLEMGPATPHLPRVPMHQGPELMRIVEGELPLLPSQFEKIKLSQREKKVPPIFPLWGGLHSVADTRAAPLNGCPVQLAPSFTGLSFQLSLH